MNASHPVWTIFSRRSFSSLAYWLSALGYNLRDRSASNRFYLLYFIFFWLLWVVAVFALLASALAPILRSLPGGSPADTIIVIYVYGLGLWLSFWLFNAGQRSPFVFPEEDAYLLCQTPVSRPAVAAAWFMQNYAQNALPLAVLTGILSFALVESSISGPIILPTILVYFRHSLLSIGLVLPVLFALQSLAWALGAWRLQYNRPPFWFRLALLPVLLWLGADRLSNLIFATPAGALLPFLRWPFQAAFARQSALEWWLALAFCLAAAALAFWLLLRCARSMNLGRAAQETTAYAAMQTARLSMQFELAETLAARQRHTASPPSHLLARSAALNILAGKDLQQILRSITPLLVLNWAMLFALTFALFLPGNWAVQGFAALVWVVTLGGLTTRRLRSDLARWWLLRSLPISPRRILAGELGLAAAFSVLLGWIALLILPNLPFDYRLTAFVCLPFTAASVALSSANDIFRHSKARTLMSPSIGEENVPSLNLWGIVQAFASAAVPLGMLSWSYLHPEQLTWGVFAVPAAMLIAMLNVQFAIGSYEEIG